MILFSSNHSTNTKILLIHNFSNFSKYRA